MGGVDKSEKRRIFHSGAGSSLEYVTFLDKFRATLEQILGEVMRLSEDEEGDEVNRVWSLALHKLTMLKPASSMDEDENDCGQYYQGA